MSSTQQLETDKVCFTFEGDTGRIVKITNKLAGEEYHIIGDEFCFEAIGFSADFKEFTLDGLDKQDGSVHASYKKQGLTVDVRYTLGAGCHFLEKHMLIIAEQNYGLNKIVVSRPNFSAGSPIRFLAYRYQKNVTYFGRTGAGGFFTGVELPYDTSWVDGNMISLGYRPSIKLQAGKRLQCEPIYFGVYKKDEGEGEASCELGQQEQPLPSESKAMVAMTSAVLGSPCHGLVPLVVVWDSNLAYKGTYTSEQQVEKDCKLYDYMSECGIDWIYDNSPWAGETDKINSLRGGEKFEHSELVCKLLDYAKRKGSKILLWGTMTNTHPWSGGTAHPWIEGKPFRPDRPEWLLTPPKKVRDLIGPASVDRPDLWHEFQGNCLGNRSFVEWLAELIKGELASGYYSGFVLDGDFFGEGGTVTPCTCQAQNHNHLPGDANYACESAIAWLVNDVRRAYPDCYIWLLRPMMDLGVWSLRDADATFAINEFGDVEPLRRLKNQPVNVSCGDKIRLWSRIRMHRHFFPHYLDQPQVFPHPLYYPWSSEKIDYIMLSALSSSPNQSYFMPQSSVISDKDKQEIKRWLDWGRENIKYLLVRKDLPVWPQKGWIDGSAHIIDGQGLIFLFNPNKENLKTEFCLDEHCLGLKCKGSYYITQYYPLSDKQQQAAYGQTVQWEVEAESAAVLEIRPK